MELSEIIEKSRVNNVFLCEGPRRPQKGSLVLTGHHLIFSPNCMPLMQNASINELNDHDQELWLLYRVVDRVIVEPFSKNPTVKQSAYLRLRCKNFMICCIEMDDLDDCNAVARSIEKLSNLNGIEHEYPFYYRCSFNILDDGWKAFNMEEQFSQLFNRCPNRWRISNVNKNFKICSTYPESVIVPKGIGDDYLRISATFRDGGRFPIFCYYHHETKSSIIRCAQPLIGPTSRRCKEDETILNALLSTATKGIIFDTRSKPIAVASKGRGGGSESQVYYCRWKYVYGNIPRIKDLHDSLAKLAELCAHEGSSSSGLFYSSLYSSISSYTSSSDRWLSRLAACGWLQHIADVITGAATVAQCIHCEENSENIYDASGCIGNREVAVVVHGAEGVDSTLLVTSIAQLCLDSDTRTIRGFQSLIEREWICAGHLFSLRCAHFAFASGTLTGPYESPVFLVFLDCVWQIMRQYPCSFEFNEQFLIFLFEHAYASEFGSFLGSCEADKAKFSVKSRTVSLWSYVNHPEVLSSFLCDYYEPYSHVLWPSVAPQSIVLWKRMYMRWHQSWADFDEAKHRLVEWKNIEKDLQSKLKQFFQKQRYIKFSSKQSQSYFNAENQCTWSQPNLIECSKSKTENVVLTNNFNETDDFLSSRIDETLQSSKKQIDDLNGKVSVSNISKNIDSVVKLSEKSGDKMAISFTNFGTFSQLSLQSNSQS